jgi:hypothetical protein
MNASARLLVLLVAIAALGALYLPEVDRAGDLASAGAGARPVIGACICEVKCWSGRPGIWEWEATYGCTLDPGRGWNWPPCNYGWQPAVHRIRCSGRPPVYVP